MKLDSAETPFAKPPFSWFLKVPRSDKNNNSGRKSPNREATPFVEATPFELALAFHSAMLVEIVLQDSKVQVFMVA